MCVHYFDIAEMSYTQYKLCAKVVTLVVQRGNVFQNNVRFGTLLQPMRAGEAGQSAPLQHMRALRP